MPLERGRQAVGAGRSYHSEKYCTFSLVGLEHITLIRLFFQTGDGKAEHVAKSRIRRN